MARSQSVDGHVYQLIYLSVRRVDEQATIFGQDLRNILATARAFNRTVGIGGALLFNGAFFAQVLEGEQSEVTALMRRIARDPRHSHVTVIEERWVSERVFPDWAMAFADDRVHQVLPIPSEFDPEVLDQPGLPAAIITAMRDLLADVPDPDGSD